jgi:hypothetical protein
MQGVTMTMQAMAARAARSLWWSQGLTVAAAGLVLLALHDRHGPCHAAVVAVVAAAGVALFFAARIAFDAIVFQRWSRAADIDAAMRAFDARLARGHWRRDITAGRTLPARIDGALRLRNALALCVVTQAALVASCR